MHSEISTLNIEKNILIKASGDVLENESFLDFCRNLSDDTKNKIVIICWAWKQINSRLSKEGYDVGYCKNWERVICSRDSDKIVRQTLAQTKNLLESKFKDRENIHVKWAWNEIAWVYCHVNADTLVITYYLWFDEIYVFTYNWNEEKKRKFFEKYDRINIIGINNS